MLLQGAYRLLCLSCASSILIAAGRLSRVTWPSFAVAALHKELFPSLLIRLAIQGVRRWGSAPTPRTTVPALTGGVRCLRCLQTRQWAASNPNPCISRGASPAVPTIQMLRSFNCSINLDRFGTLATCTYSSALAAAFATVSARPTARRSVVKTACNASALSCPQHCSKVARIFQTIETQSQWRLISRHLMPLDLHAGLPHRRNERRLSWLLPLMSGVSGGAFDLSARQHAGQARSRLWPARTFRVGRS